MEKHTISVTSEKYRAWHPAPEIQFMPSVDGISDVDSGLIIALSFPQGDLRQLNLTFESAVAYRNINESYRLRTWNALAENRWDGGFYIVENSRWIKWLRIESGGVLDGVDLAHYAIFTDEDCIDIATEFDPLLERMA